MIDYDRGLTKDLINVIPYRGHLVSVYLVDGFHIRNKFDIDFLTYGHSFKYEFIPDDELWIDTGYDSEWKIFAIRGLEEMYQMACGKTYTGSITYLRDLDSVLRQNTFGNFSEGLIQKEFLFNLEGISVFLVDGMSVRNRLDVDFTFGGNPMIYGFIPPLEIWIDNLLHKGEIPYTIIHEFIEMMLMLEDDNMSYQKAHESANTLEKELRSSESLQSPEDVIDFLKQL